MPRFQSPLSTFRVLGERTPMTMGNDVCPLSPPLHILPDPQKGAPLTELQQGEMLPFRRPQLSLKFPVSGLPRFPNGPLQGETSVSRAFFYTFPAKPPVNEPPLHVLQQGPYGERSFISRDNGLFIHRTLGTRRPSRAALA